jgi:TorA maturation chaperone TorD
VDEKLINRRAISQVCLILAEFYKYPSDHFFAQITTGTIIQELMDELQNAHIDVVIDRDKWQRLFHNYSEVKKEYIRCFIGRTVQHVVPVESVYKVWTTNKEAQVVFASSKGYLMGDSAMHIKYLLDKLGLEIPKEFEYTPDHITILLELLAYIVESCNSQDAYQYVSEHFDWVEEFYHELQQINASLLFKEVTQVVIVLVKHLSALFIGVKN